MVFHKFVSFRVLLFERISCMIKKKNSTKNIEKNVLCISSHGYFLGLRFSVPTNVSLVKTA